MSNYAVGNVGKDLTAVPFGTLLTNMALGIAESQWALDKSSIRVTELMSGQRLLRDIDTGQLLTKEGTDLPEGAEPQVIDSRVYFGYDYISQSAEASDFAITVTDGAITGISLSGTSGKDYNYAPRVEIVPKPGKTGSGAEAKATIDDAGRVTKVELVTGKGGSDYEEGEVTLNFIGGGGKRVPRKLSMIELGFTPNFYQFIDTIIEIKIVVNMVESKETSKTQTEKTVAQKQSSTEYSSRGHGWSWWRPRTSSYRRKESAVITKTVDPAMANKFSYSVEGSSLFRTKLVPVPPPTILEERIRLLMETEEMHRDARLAAGDGDGS